MTRASPSASPAGAVAGFTAVCLFFGVPAMIYHDSRDAHRMQIQIRCIQEHGTWEGAYVGGRCVFPAQVRCAATSRTLER